MKRQIVPAVVAAAVAVAVTACAAIPGSSTSLAPPHATKLQAKAVASFATTIGAKGPVVGVNLYANHNLSTATTEVDGERMLAYIKNTLNATAVDLVWNAYVTSFTSDSVAESSQLTETPADIGILTQIAQQDGLYVEYRPLLFVGTDLWEGDIKPANPAEWFNSYYQMNLPYLEMAQKYKINEYVIGTEMTKLTPEPQWPSFLAEAGKVYKGEISYTADEYNFFPPNKLAIPQTTLTGVDMYMPLPLSASAPLSEVVPAYESFFAKLPASLLRRTAIQETGIEARAGAYQDPPNLGTTGTLDEDVQANFFTAGCEAVKKFHLRGIFFWKVDLADNPVHPTTALSVFEGREGAVAISECESILKG